MNPNEVQPTAPAPAPKKSFMTYVMSDIPNHLKVIGFVVVLALIVFGWNYVRDLRRELSSQQMITATLAQRFQQLGTSGVVQTDNTQGTKADVTTQTSDAFGAAVLKMMKQQNALINSLTTAVGLTKTTTSALPVQPAAFVPESHSAATGALSGYVMEESRNGAPPLSSVSLYYLPSESDPSKAFAGTTWTHYQEVFAASIGSWEKQKNGGLTTTVKLTRTVSKPDPLNPTKLLMIGTEDIPITGANTLYSPTGLVDPASVTVPRWTLGLGVSTGSTTVRFGNSTTPQLKPFGTIDYRFTNRFGVFTGLANGGIVGGVSIRFGSPK